MKKLYTILLTMVIALTFVISPLYATEIVEAATATYTTEKDSNKVYFNWKSRVEDKVTLPLDYKLGPKATKNYYETEAIVCSSKVNPGITLDYDKKIVDVKTVKSHEGTRLLIKPKKVGKTTVKATFKSKGFNTYTKSISVVVSKAKTKLAITFSKGRNIYETEYDSIKEGFLKESTKLFWVELNAERAAINLRDYVNNSAYEYAVLNEKIKLINNSKIDYKTLPEFKSNSVFQDLTKERYSQLLKLGMSDKHAGFYELASDSKYDDYIINEVITLTGGYASPYDMVESYKGSKLHWGKLTNPMSYAVYTVCFKTKAGATMNVTNSGAYFNPELTDELLNVDSKYEYLMTPEERDYYGVDGTDYDDSEDYQDSLDDNGWSI